MSYTIQDLSPYFENLKIELAEKSKKRNLKYSLIYFVLFQIVNQLAYHLMHHYSLLPESKLGYLTPYMSGTFGALIFWFIISQFTDVKILNNNNYVNLYDALNYLHRDKIKKLNNFDFQNFIDMEYQKERLNELTHEINTSKDIHQQNIETINALYENKEKLVSVDSILKKELHK